MSKRKDAKATEKLRRSVAGKPLGNVGQQTAAGLACPVCGGTQFTAKRKGGAVAAGAVTFGVGAVLVPKSKVRCVTCGTDFERGGSPKPAAPPPRKVKGPPPPPPAAPPAQQPAVHIVEVPAAAQGTAAGWYPDPTGRHEQRWWGGVSWMDAVADQGAQSGDPDGVRLMDQPQPTQTMAEQLRELAELRDRGILTDAEFAAQKARLLA